MSFLLAVLAATGAWFVAAAILFFNPPVDKIYRSEEEHPAVKVLPQSPITIGKILLAVVIQCALWAWIYTLIKAGLPADPNMKALIFSAVIVLVKIIPRDIDRILLTTYPSKRLTIEFIVGIICAAVVGFVFAYML